MILTVPGKHAQHMVMWLKTEAEQHTVCNFISFLYIIFVNQITRNGIFFAHRVCAFLLPNYPPKGLYQFIRIIEAYGEKTLSSFLTFASAIGKTWFSFYFVIITKVNIPFVSSAAYLIIVYACFLLSVFYPGS